MEERREGDSDTGEMSFVQTGAGISDIFWKVASKLIGKTAQKLATKAAEKGVEKIGEKTGQLIGEKIYDKFSSKKTSETKGKEIMEILKQENIPKEVDKYQYIKDFYNDLL